MRIPVSTRTAMVAFLQLLTVLVLTGCLAAMPVQQTASGRAEVSLNGSVAKQAIARIIGEALIDENFRMYKMRSRSDADVAYERVVDSLYAGDHIIFEITFLALEVDGKTRVVADALNYTRSKGVAGQKKDSGAATRNMAQLLLNRVQASMERAAVVESKAVNERKAK